MVKTLEEIEKRDLTGLSFKELLALKENLEKNLKDELKISYITDEEVNLLLPDITADKTIPLD